MKESVIAMNTPINHLTAGFIGLGLIGGSIARGLKRSAPDIQIMAYMRTREKLEQAHADGIVDHSGRRGRAFKRVRHHFPVHTG